MAGDIYIDDKRITHCEPRNRGIAMVFQNYSLYPHMSIFDNMAYGLKIRGFGKQKIRHAGKCAAWTWPRLSGWAPITWLMVTGKAVRWWYA